MKRYQGRGGGETMEKVAMVVLASKKRRFQKEGMKLGIRAYERTNE